MIQLSVSENADKRNTDEVQYINNSLSPTRKGFVVGEDFFLLLFT